MSSFNYRLGRAACGLLLSSMALAGLPAKVLAQASTAYPDRALRLIVPFPPGGGMNNAARLLAVTLGEKLEQTIVVENRPSAGGVLAEATVAKAAQDGYTALYDSFALAVNAIRPSLPFDVRKDLIPVASTATSEMVLVVSAELPVRSVHEFIEYARARPGKISFGSTGIGSPAHLSGELFKEAANIDMLHVPYRGGANALNDLLGGSITSFFANPSAAIPFLEGGKLRALAVTGPKRADAMPDIPSMTEAGLPDVVLETWHGVFLPRGTPMEVVQKLSSAVQESLRTKTMDDQLRNIGFTPMITTQSEFEDFINTQIDRWGGLVKSKGIKID